MNISLTGHNSHQISEDVLKVNSMTGFGRAEITIQETSYTIEVKSVNHRYLDVGIKTPRQLFFLEEKIRQSIKQVISRGRLDCYINQRTAENSEKQVRVDENLCRAYKQTFDHISSLLEIKNDLSVSMLVRMPEVIRIEQIDIDENSFWDEFKGGLTMALDQLVTMRNKEGKATQDDLFQRIEHLKGFMNEIQALSPEVTVSYKDKLTRRIGEMLHQEIEIDHNRIMTEVAILTEKSCIDEEIVRFNSHLEQFMRTIYLQESVGRKLDFLVQELNREINTIGSKAGDLKVGALVVQVKSELEKIREQVQNIE